MEESAGGVLYTRKGKQRLYVVVCEHDGHIGLPKGHVEKGESTREAALREIWEETGVQACLIGDIALEETYVLPRGGEKHVTYYLARFEGALKHDPTQVKEAKLLPFRQAVVALTFAGARRILQEAEQALKELGE